MNNYQTNIRLTFRVEVILCELKKETKRKRAKKSHFCLIQFFFFFKFESSSLLQLAISWFLCIALFVLYIDTRLYEDQRATD